MKKILFFSIVALLLVGCDKSQNAVKKLDGEWKAITYIYTTGGSSVDILISEGIGLSVDFDNCKLKKDEFCKSTWVFSEAGETDDIEVVEYRVEGYGTSLELKYIDMETELALWDITELSKDKLVLENHSDSGTSLVITLEKEG